MKKLWLITGSLWLLALGWHATPTAARTARLHTAHHENVLGTSLELKLLAASDNAAARAEAAALAEIDRVGALLSSYDVHSEFSRWRATAHEPVRVSPELFDVLHLFEQWRTRTDGALDAAAAAVSRVWQSAAQAQRMPANDELQAAVAAVQQPHWRLDAAQRTATHLSAAPLALNSFAKSYIIQRAADAALQAGGLDAVIVNLGGDLVVRGALTETVAIADPQDDAENAPPLLRLRVRDRAVATSGNYRRGVQIGDRWFSHIVDPRTGQPAGHIRGATVVAPNATDAGALATAFNVLTPAESLRLAAQLPNVACLLITASGEQIASPGWRALVVPSPSPTRSLNTPAVQAWDTSFEMTLNFELANISDRRYRRPYVAAWLEDKDKVAVRTLALWYQKPRWLPDMKAWSRAERLRALAEGDDITVSVSSATRAPGKYTLKWDGKDNKGKLVKPGRYTLYLEVAREHGTYQLIRQDVDCTGKPQQFTLPANEEVAGATLSYGKKTK